MSPDESETNMMTSTEGRERGQKRAERGIKRAASNHNLDIARDTIRYLNVLLASSTGCATLDDSTLDLQSKHSDGGKWRGSIPKRLRASGIIVSEGAVKSTRPARHAGYVTLWRLVDRDAALAYRAALVTELDGKRRAGQMTLPGCE